MAPRCSSGTKRLSKAWLPSNSIDSRILRGQLKWCLRAWILFLVSSKSRVEQRNMHTRQSEGEPKENL